MHTVILNVTVNVLVHDAPKLARSLFYVDFVVSSSLLSIFFIRRIQKQFQLFTPKRKSKSLTKMSLNLKLPSVAIVSIVNNNLNFSISAWDAVIVVYILSSSSYLQILYNQAQQSVQQQK